MADLRLALLDLARTFQKLGVSLYFAWGDTRARYRRSVLGPFWLVLGTALGVVGLGFVWSELMQVNRSEFIPSLSVGLVVWQLISGCVNEASGIFVQNARFIRNIPTPYFTFPLQLVLRQVINFLHNALVVALVIIYYDSNISFKILLVIPGFVLVVGILFWISSLIGLLGARYRDLSPLVGALMPLVFFLTPVIYRPSQLAVLSYVAWLNPFTYLIALIRDPLQGHVPEPFVYVTAISFFAVGMAINVLAYGLNHKKIAFWI